MNDTCSLKIQKNKFNICSFFLSSKGSQSVVRLLYIQKIFLWGIRSVSMLASPIEEKLQEKQKAESDLSLFRNRMIKLWETNRVSMHYIPPFNNSYIQSANSFNYTYLPDFEEALGLHWWHGLILQDTVVWYRIPLIDLSVLIKSNQWRDREEEVCSGAWQCKNTESNLVWLRCIL